MERSGSTYTHYPVWHIARGDLLCSTRSSTVFRDDLEAWDEEWDGEAGPGGGIYACI